MLYGKLKLVCHFIRLLEIVTSGWVFENCSRCSIIAPIFLELIKWVPFYVMKFIRELIWYKEASSS